MSLSGINSNPLLASLGTGVRPTTGPAATPAATPGASRSQVEAPATERARGSAPARPSIASVPTSVPSEAPPGTDPELWSVLTAEERTFFSKTAALGPLTYGKIKSATLPAPPAVRGGRLDVRA